MDTEREKFKSRKRKSSILKSRGELLADIDPNKQFDDTEVISPKSQRPSRRVSFANTYQVKEFSKESPNTWPPEGNTENGMNVDAIKESSALAVTQTITGLNKLLTGLIHNPEHISHSVTELPLPELSDGCSFNCTSAKGQIVLDSSVSATVDSGVEPSNSRTAEAFDERKVNSQSFYQNLSAFTRNKVRLCQISKSQLPPSEPDAYYKLTNPFDFKTVINTSINKHSHYSAVQCDVSISSSKQLDDQCNVRIDCYNHNSHDCLARVDSSSSLGKDRPEVDEPKVNAQSFLKRLHISSKDIHCSDGDTVNKCNQFTLGNDNTNLNGKMAKSIDPVIQNLHRNLTGDVMQHFDEDDIVVGTMYLASCTGSLSEKENIYPLQPSAQLNPAEDVTRHSDDKKMAGGTMGITSCTADLSKKKNVYPAGQAAQLNPAEDVTRYFDDDKMARGTMEMTSCTGKIILPGTADLTEKENVYPAQQSSQLNPVEDVSRYFDDNKMAGGTMGITSCTGKIILPGTADLTEKENVYSAQQSSQLNPVEDVSRYFDDNKMAGGTMGITSCTGKIILPGTADLTEKENVYSAQQSSQLNPVEDVSRYFDDNKMAGGTMGITSCTGKIILPGTADLTEKENVYPAQQSSQLNPVEDVSRYFDDNKMARETMEMTSCTGKIILPGTADLSEKENIYPAQQSSQLNPVEDVSRYFDDNKMARETMEMTSCTGKIILPGTGDLSKKKNVYPAGQAAQLNPVEDVSRYFDDNKMARETMEMTSCTGKIILPGTGDLSKKKNVYPAGQAAQLNPVEDVTQYFDDDKMARETMEMTSCTGKIILPGTADLSENENIYPAQQSSQLNPVEDVSRYFDDDKMARKTMEMTSCTGKIILPGTGGLSKKKNVYPAGQAAQLNPVEDVTQYFDDDKIARETMEMTSGTGKIILPGTGGLSKKKNVYPAGQSAQLNPVEDVTQYFDDNKMARGTMEMTSCTGKIILPGTADLSEKENVYPAGQAAQLNPVEDVTQYFDDNKMARGTMEMTSCTGKIILPSTADLYEKENTYQAQQSSQLNPVEDVTQYFDDDKMARETMEMTSCTGKIILPGTGGLSKKKNVYPAGQSAQLNPVEDVTQYFDDNKMARGTMEMTLCTGKIILPGTGGLSKKKNVYPAGQSAQLNPVEDVTQYFDDNKMARGTMEMTSCTGKIILPGTADLSEKENVYPAGQAAQLNPVEDVTQYFDDNKMARGTMEMTLCTGKIILPGTADLSEKENVYPAGQAAQLNPVEDVTQYFDDNKMARGTMEMTSCTGKIILPGTADLSEKENAYQAQQSAQINTAEDVSQYFDDDKITRETMEMIPCTADLSEKENVDPAEDVTQYFDDDKMACGTMEMTSCTGKIILPASADLSKKENVYPARQAAQLDSAGDVTCRFDDEEMVRGTIESSFLGDAVVCEKTPIVEPLKNQQLGFHSLLPGFTKTENFQAEKNLSDKKANRQHLNLLRQMDEPEHARTSLLNTDTVGPEIQVDLKSNQTSTVSDCNAGGKNKEPISVAYTPETDAEYCDISADMKAQDLHLPYNLDFASKMFCTSKTREFAETAKLREVTKSTNDGYYRNHTDGGGNSLTTTTNKELITGSRVVPLRFSRYKDCSKSNIAEKYGKNINTLQDHFVKSRTSVELHKQLQSLESIIAKAKARPKKPCDQLFSYCQDDQRTDDKESVFLEACAGGEEQSFESNRRHGAFDELAANVTNESPKNTKTKKEYPKSEARDLSDFNTNEIFSNKDVKTFFPCIVTAENTPGSTFQVSAPSCETMAISNSERPSTCNFLLKSYAPECAEEMEKPGSKHEDAGKEHLENRTQEANEDLKTSVGSINYSCNRWKQRDVTQLKQKSLSIHSGTLLEGINSSQIKTCFPAAKNEVNSKSCCRSETRSKTSNQKLIVRSENVSRDKKKCQFALFKNSNSPGIMDEEMPDLILEDNSPVRKVDFSKQNFEGNNIGVPAVYSFSSSFVSSDKLKLETSSDILKLFDVNFWDPPTSRHSSFYVSVDFHQESRREMLENACLNYPEYQSYVQSYHFFEKEEQRLKEKLQEVEKRQKEQTLQIFLKVQEATKDGPSQLSELKDKVQACSQACRKFSKKMIKDNKTKQFSDLLSQYQEMKLQLADSCREFQKTIAKMDNNLTTVDEVLENLDIELEQLSEISELSEEELNKKISSLAEVDKVQQLIHSLSSERTKLMECKNSLITEAEEKEISLQALIRVRDHQIKMKQQLERHLEKWKRYDCILPWKLLEVNNVKISFLFLHNTLGFSVHTRPSENSVCKREIICMTFESYLNVEDSYKWIKRCHSLLHLTINTKSLQSVYSNTSQLAQILDQLSSKLCNLEKLAKEIECMSLMYLLDADESSVTVEYSSMSPLAKVFVTYRLDPSTYPFTAIEFSVKTVYGNIRKEDLVSRLHSVKPGHNYFTRLIKAADLTESKT